MIISHFLLMAISAAAIASISSGIVGSYIVVKRIVFISGAISHSVLGGMGFFLYLNRTLGLSFLHPIYGALLMALISSLLIGWIHIHYKQREDTVIASIWALGMSIGVIFVSLTPGYNVDLMNFLFGNLLWTSASDLLLLFSLDVVVIAIVLLCHKRFLAICFDEMQARLQGAKVNRIYVLLLALISLVVVLLIQIIGAILVIAMLCLPAAIANHFTSRLSTMMVVAVLIGGFSSIIGTLLSYAVNWPPGATIALFTTVSYLVVVEAKKRMKTFVDAS